MGRCRRKRQLGDLPELLLIQAQPTPGSCEVHSASGAVFMLTRLMSMASCREERERAVYALRTPVAGESPTSRGIRLLDGEYPFGQHSRVCRGIQLIVGELTLQHLEGAAGPHGAETVVDCSSVNWASRHYRHPLQQ